RLLRTLGVTRARAWWQWTSTVSSAGHYFRTENSMHSGSTTDIHWENRLMFAAMRYTVPTQAVVMQAVAMQAVLMQAVLMQAVLMQALVMQALVMQALVMQTASKGHN